MKIKLSFTLALVVVSIVAYGDIGLCQISPFGTPNASVISTKGHPAIGSGTFLGLIVTSASIYPAMNGLKKITVVNTDTGIDDNTYELPLTPNIQNLICEWNSEEEFTGQYGTYRFIIDRSPTNIMSETPWLPPNLIPLPIPENLEVNFESGITTPTLSIDPVSEEVDFDVYEFRVYDKDYTRRIYRTRIFLGEDPITIFGTNRFQGQTGEDLIPGERYIFRADIYKYYGGTTVPMLMGMNFRSFKVPKKEHSECE